MGADDFDMNDCENVLTKFQEARAKAMVKGHLTKLDLFRMYRAMREDVDDLENDLLHISESRPDVNLNTDVSLEWARVDALKPNGYDEWLKAED